MKILAVEFSSDQRSVAVMEGRELRGIAAEIATRETHAFTMIKTALGEAKMEREEIECIAVGTGPGSYTGIRSAIALAQGWQLARPVKLLGIGIAECLAAQARDAGWRGRVNIVIDAQRNEFYLGRYDINDDGDRESAALRLASFDEVKALAVAGEIVAGPGIQKAFPSARDWFPSAETLGRLAEGRTDFVAGEDLTPVYLRAIAFVKAAPARVLPEN